MPDNPRIPGHPSDMPSSRSSDSGQAGGTFQNSNQPPYYPPSQQPPNHQARNIILGAVATVITSTIIYYLTVYMNSNKSGDTRLQMKEATVEAWKSYRAYENTYTNNMMTFEKTVAEDQSLVAYRKGLESESAKFVDDVSDLMKQKNIDKDLVKALNRRLNNENDLLANAKKYYNRIDSFMVIANSGNPQAVRKAYINEEIRWSIYYRGAYDRSLNDVQEIAKTLSERYGQSFGMEDFLLIKLHPERQRKMDSLTNVLKNLTVDEKGNIVQKHFEVNLNKKDFEGKWNVDGDVVAMAKNGTANWVFAEGDKATGTWKIEEDQLIVQGIFDESKEKFRYAFRVSNLTSSSFTVSQTDPYLQYEATRIPVN